jgi:ABC-type transport system substrate-binding protein
MKRYQFIAIMCVVLTFGCSRPDQRVGGDESEGGTPAPGDWNVVRLEGEPDSLNPILSTTAVATTVQYGVNQSQILETLLQFNMNDWKFTEPLLAESYPEISEDHLVYTFTLRDGIKWHDGKPFTVDDVVFTAKAMMSPLVDSAILRSYFVDLTNVERLDGRKVRFTFSQPNMLNVFNLGTLSIIPTHVYDAGGLLDSISYHEMIGTKGRNDSNARKFAEEFNRHPASRTSIGTGRVPASEHFQHHGRYWDHELAYCGAPHTRRSA